MDYCIRSGARPSETLPKARRSQAELPRKVCDMTVKSGGTMQMGRGNPRPICNDEALPGDYWQRSLLPF